MMERDYKLLVFDWDGTLMDSRDQIVACLQAAGQDLGLPPRTAGQISDIIGLGLQEAVDRLYPGHDPGLQKDLAERYRHHYFAGLAPARLFDGVPGVLRHLYQAGYLLAVATGKGRRGLDMVLTDTGLNTLFHATRASDETRSKPHPLMLEQIFEQLDVPPERALMIGDSEYDMEMAARAGCHALAVSYGVHSAGRLLRHEPRGCLDHITELPAWLEEDTAPAGRIANRH